MTPADLAAGPEWEWKPPVPSRTLPGYFRRRTPAGRWWIIHHEPDAHNSRTGAALPFRLDLCPSGMSPAPLRTFHGDTLAVLVDLAAELDATS